MNSNIWLWVIAVGTVGLLTYYAFRAHQAREAMTAKLNDALTKNFLMDHRMRVYMLAEAYPIVHSIEAGLMDKPKFQVGDGVLVRPGYVATWLWGWEKISSELFKEETFGRIIKVGRNDSLFHEIVHELFENWLYQKNLEFPLNKSELLNLLTRFIIEKRDERKTRSLIYWSYHVDFEGRIPTEPRYDMAEDFLTAYAHRDAASNI